MAEGGGGDTDERVAFEHEQSPHTVPVTQWQCHAYRLMPTHTLCTPRCVATALRGTAATATTGSTATAVARRKLLPPPLHTPSFTCSPEAAAPAIKREPPTSSKAGCVCIPQAACRD